MGPPLACVDDDSLGRGAKGKIEKIRWINALTGLYPWARLIMFTNFGEEFRIVLGAVLRG